MPDVVVVVPKGLWASWIEEGDLPGQVWSHMENHFWIPRRAMPLISPGERVYVVAHGRLRGYAPLVTIETRCRMRPERACLLRRGRAEAVTIPEPVRGFQGWRYRWWLRENEQPFTEWREP